MRSIIKGFSRHISRISGNASNKCELAIVVASITFAISHHQNGFRHFAHFITTVNAINLVVIV